MHAPFGADRQKGAGQRRAHRQDRADDARIVDQVVLEGVMGEDLDTALLDVLLGHAQPLDPERVVGVAVGIDDRLDRLVGDLAEVLHDIGGEFVVFAGVDDDDAVIADDHGHAGDAVAYGDIDLVLDRHVDAAAHLPGERGLLGIDGVGSLGIGEVVAMIDHQRRQMIFPLIVFGEQFFDLGLIGIRRKDVTRKGTRHSNEQRRHLGATLQTTNHRSGGAVLFPFSANIHRQTSQSLGHRPRGNQLQGIWNDERITTGRTLPQLLMPSSAGQREAGDSFMKEPLRSTG